MFNSVQRTGPFTLPTPQPDTTRQPRRPDEVIKGFGQDLASFFGWGPEPEQPDENPFSPRSAVGQLWTEAQVYGERPELAGLRWNADRPLGEAVNAHSTNTVGDMKHALRSDHGYNWLEGDIRKAIDEKDQLEMRHEIAHEPGDNMTLEEWLEVGKASGRGLKLDIKESDAVEGVIATLKRVDVPQERLMLNLSDKDMAAFGPKLRQAFPEARLAINPATSLPGKESGDGPYESWQVDRMIAHADKLGGPSTFVLRFDKVTPAIVKKLEAHGQVSIWNEPFYGGVTDPASEREKLKRWGVSGVIDLRESYGTLEKALKGGKLAWQYGKFYAEQGLQAGFNGMEKVASLGKKAWDGTIGKLF